MFAAFHPHHLGVAGLDRKLELIRGQRSLLRIDENIHGLESNGLLRDWGLGEQCAEQHRKQKQP